MYEEVQVFRTLEGLFLTVCPAEILEHPLLSMLCDRMLVRYMFDKPYCILVLTRNDWSTEPVHSSRKCSA